MARHDQISRIFLVLQLLEANPRGFTLKQLHERVTQDYEVNDRSLRRDIEALQGIGYEIDLIDNPDDSNKAKLIKLNSTLKATKQLVLNPGELLALYLAKNLLLPLKETAFYQDLEKVFRQIDLVIQEKDREYLKEISEELKFEPGPRWGLGVQPDVVDTVREACTNSQILKFEYRSVNSKSESTRLVGPHFLYFAKGSLYLVAEDLSDNKIKIFSIPRFKTAEMTTDVYSGSKVDPEEFFSKSFGVFQTKEPVKIKLIFANELADYVKERRWHASQRVINKSDGTIEMLLDVGLTPDLVQWILGFGSKVEVIEPSALRDELQKAAEAVFKLYQTSHKKSELNKKKAS